MGNRHFLKSQVPEWDHGRWVQVYVDQDPEDGNHGYARVVENHGTPGVAVLPISDDRIGMVRLYRPPISREIVEIPRGMSDSGNLRVEAARELLEETGLKVDPAHLVDLGSVFPNGGLLETQLRVFAAPVQVADQTTTPQDTNEIDQFLWIPVQEVLEAIRLAPETEDSPRDAFTEVAILRAFLHGLLPIESLPGKGH